MNLEFEFSTSNTDPYEIPLNEIHLATQTFSSQARIGGGRFLDVYKGRLSARWQNRLAVFRRLNPDDNQNFFAFRSEVSTGIICSHETIVSFIGYYYDEGKEYITVYEYASNDRLDEYLRDSNKRRSLTWVQRLKICLKAARGLAHLHWGMGRFTVIHRNVSSAKIWLDDNMEAKIGGLDMAILYEEGQPEPFSDFGVADPSYQDPKYKENEIINRESDIYSYGMVMFEMLTGKMIYQSKSLGGNQPRGETLKDYVLQYNDEALNSLIDPHVRDQIDIHSFEAFKNIAYECISLNPKNRPSMNKIETRLMDVLDYLQNRGTSSTSTSRSPQHRNLRSYLIPLNLIKWVTQNFSSNNQIGDGGFGVVYKANLSIGGQISTVAVKRLNPKGHQGEQEFRTELELFCRFQHPNIIPFIGYCDEEKEMIMVSKYAVNGSLDQYLEDDPYKRGSLTWAQRLKICLGAARGLEYIHSRQGLVIHRDIKSANILLDENLEAKICDFGLSKEGIRNQDTHLFTKAAGTKSYIDPIYQESGILRKESDVYSFGIVLFEMLSGMLAYRPKRLGDGGPQLLINLVRRYYIEGPEMLIDPIIRDQIDKRCFQTFKDTAYSCISYNLEERPTMETICYKITAALELQVEMEKTYQHPSKQQQSSSFYQTSSQNSEEMLSHYEQEWWKKTNSV